MIDIINKHNLKLSDDTDEYTRYDGFTMNNDIETPDGFKDVIEWADSSFRSVWISDTKQAVFTYCEGDLILKEFKTQAAYNKNVAEADEFYKAH